VPALWIWTTSGSSRRLFPTIPCFCYDITVIFCTLEGIFLFRLENYGISATMQAYYLLVLTTLCWGLNAVFARMAVGEISPMLLVSVRWLDYAGVLSASPNDFVLGAKRSICTNGRWGNFTNVASFSPLAGHTGPPCSLCG